MLLLAAGLKFLHNKNIIHRDLKPQNLLLSSRDQRKAVLKIADFGFARFVDPQSVVHTLCGSPLYMVIYSTCPLCMIVVFVHWYSKLNSVTYVQAPEILLCQPYDGKADLWSVGAILYEMLTGSPPFNVRTHIELVRLLVTEQVRYPKNLNVSAECLDLLQSLLKKNKDERISWHDFFRHPFISGTQPTLPPSMPTSIPVTTRAIDIPKGNKINDNHRNRDRRETIGSAPTNVGIFPASSSPMPISPISASLPMHKIFHMGNTPNTTTALINRSPPNYLPGNSSPILGIPRESREPSSISPPNYMRSPTSFGENFGWPSEIRKPKTNPFKESLDLPSPKASIPPSPMSSFPTNVNEVNIILQSHPPLPHSQVLSLIVYIYPFQFTEWVNIHRGFI